MIDEREQFRILYRDFLRRSIDLDVLSAGGDPGKLFGHFAAILAALNLVVAIYLIPGYAASTLPPERLRLAATGDQQFLASLTMAIVGLFGVLAWGALFPDRRDCLVLGTLPVRNRTIFAAKLAAVGTGLGVSVVAANLFTGISYPFVAPSPVPGAMGAVRSFAAYWVTMSAAGVFVFAALLALQGLTIALLPFRLVRRIAALEQLAALFAIMAVFLLTPGGAIVSVTSPANRDLLGSFPSYWFLGLYQQINGSIHEVFEFLASRAIAALAITGSLAAGCYALLYYRGARAAVEQPDIAPTARSGTWSSAVNFVFRNSVDQAIIPFTIRTLARSAQHRLILAAYLGAGAAVALAYCRRYIFAGSSLYATERRHMTISRWDEPNVPFLAASLVTLICAIIGTRAVFALPSALKSNWVFRVTAVHRPLTYFSAVRKAFYLLAAVPVWILSAVALAAIWRPAPALAHLSALALVAVILTEKGLRGFFKIPFACAYSPGKANLPVSLGVRGAAFLFLVDLGSRVELHAIHKRARYFVLMAALALLATRMWRKRAKLASEQSSRLTFDDAGLPDIAPLDFRRDGIWGSERFVDQGDPSPERSVKQRIGTAAAKAAAALALLCVAGAAYEGIEARRERQGIAQAGQFFDIGGRRINVSCMGEGTTVVFESGGGGIGYYWIGIQREVAKFARACWYDRAGQGWSDPAPYPRDAHASARDLRELVRAGALGSPLVLVGASLGGLIVRVYASRHPADVAGIVLVDSSHVDEYEPIRPPHRALHRGAVTLAHVLWRIGALRFFFGDDDPGLPPKGLDEDDWRIARSFGPGSFAESAKVPFEESLLQARFAPRISGVPLIVLTAGLPPAWATNPVEARQAVARQKKWIEAQTQLLRFSSPSRQVVVESSHCIQCVKPEAIVAAVRELVTGR